MNGFYVYLFIAFSLLVDASTPLARIKNGTYVGKYVSEWVQDHFLGIPYAQPPLGSLRFARPQSLNSSFQGVRTVTEYGYNCYQYGKNFFLSEDCLTLNVLRPAGTTCEDKLPVLVWIYGGGLYAGSTADPQYNLSGIASVGQQIGKPIIAEGNSNAGLLDQFMAFRWIKENVEAFGGDPSRITIWGESAGAQSIGYHLQSYNGGNNNLYQSVILESGSIVGTQIQDLAYYASPVENLTRTTNCYTSSNQLACLRNLTSDQLYKAQVSQTWNPLIDGDFLTAYPSGLMAQGNFARIPLLIGANSDEGCSFGASGLNTRKLLELYPNDPTNEPPYYIKKAAIFPDKGLQWRRGAAIAGDLVMISGGRKTCEAYSSASLPVFSYRFDTPLWNAAVTDGAKHFINVQFSMQNISGTLGPLPKYETYRTLSQNIGRAYISFVYDHDPNTSRGNSTLPYWPRYSNEEPQNMVLNSNRTYIEPDTFRSAGISFINTIDRELLA